jgi:hypothetical protein
VQLAQFAVEEDPLKIPIAQACSVREALVRLRLLTRIVDFAEPILTFGGDPLAEAKRGMSTRSRPNRAAP